jgi:hypothetical protein
MNISSDDELDRLLRDVAVPAELAAHLKGITNPSDEDLDELLCGVAMPEALAMQLHAIPEDELIAGRLQDVATPYTLREQVQLKTPEQRWQTVAQWVIKMSIAAVLFLAVSATLFTSTAAYLTSIYPPLPEPQWVVLPEPPETWEGALVEPPATEIDARSVEPTRSFVTTTSESDVPDSNVALLPNWD